MELRAVEFSTAYLARVQEFECGVDDWSRLAERWIKSAPPFPGAVESMRKHGNAVWLHFLDAANEEHLVGFSSLGVTRWTVPPPDGPLRDVGFLPMLAIASRFQGKPVRPDGRHYVDDLIEHVMAQARERGYRELCLFVHENNARAVRLYIKHGFAVLGVKDDRGLLKMLRLLD